MPVYEVVAGYLRKKGIIVQGFSEWEGFTDELFVERDQVQKEIKRRRRQNQTYTHSRQVKAESEVAVITTQVRQRKLSISGHETQEAFFLSNSRVVDNLPNQARRICITSESLLEWIFSIGELQEGEANAIFDQLLWEIAKEGVDVVPRLNLLRMFHNTINVSRENLEETVSEHRRTVRELYSVDPEKAFKDLDPLCTPGVVDIVKKDVLNALKIRLHKEKERRIKAEKTAKTAVKDSVDYERLKEDRRQRQAKAKSKNRAAQSRKGKPRKKKHKKQKKRNK